MTRYRCPNCGCDEVIAYAVTSVSMEQVTSVTGTYTWTFVGNMCRDCHMPVSLWGGEDLASEVQPEGEFSMDLNAAHSGPSRLEPVRVPSAAHLNDDQTDEWTIGRHTVEVQARHGRFRATADAAEEGGYTIRARGFPEVVSQGETLQECFRNIAEVFDAIWEEHNARGEEMVTEDEAE